MEGYTRDYRRTYGGTDRKIALKGGEVVRISDIPALFDDEDALFCLDFYSHYRMMGMAYGGGWAQQPARLVEIVRLLDPLDRKYRPRLL
jgi:hypothetical protein